MNTRDTSLDAFRGLTVLLMVLVNVQGSGDNAFGFLQHSEWNGLTLADVIFPTFLVIVGLSLPLALDRQHSGSPWPGIVRRTLVLFAWGVVLSWLIRPRLEFHEIRLTGVLQRIALVYLAAAAVVLARRGYRLAAALALVLIGLHSWLLLAVPAPGASAPSLVAGEGISGWIDAHFIPGRVFRKTWDPEGILSTLPAIASALIGVATMRWMRMRGGVSTPALGALAILLIAAGFALATILPVNKALWTGSFALLTAGLGLGTWAGLRLVWPFVGQGRVGGWLILFGQTALTLYVAHTLLLAVIVRKLPSGEKIWDVLYQGLASTGLAPPVASLLFAMIATLLCALLLPTLKRRGWLIKA
jgi:predicted acyltransferase